MLSALVEVPSVALLASTLACGVRHLLEQLIPVAIVATLIAFMPHDGSLIQMCRMRSRFTVTPMLRSFLTGASLQGDSTIVLRCTLAGHTGSVLLAS
jgi:hypothetical protein